MAQVTLGNHAAVVVSLPEQDAVRRFYRDVLGCALTRSAHDKDDFVLGGDFYLAVVYADEAVTLGKEDFLKATDPELRTGNLGEVQQRIIDFGVKVIEIDDPHLYFPSPWRASLPARRHGRGHVQLRGHHAPPPTTGRSVQLARRPSSKLTVTAPRGAVVRTRRAVRARTTMRRASGAGPTQE
jgi:catechol 2,3-dioxygenase-like lactoylglutathione lyase family enzyme